MKSRFAPERGDSAVLKVLVVDDFAGFRRFVRARLDERAEFWVAEASSGLEAIQKAKDLQPDLILLDIGLPDIDGIEVARRLRSLQPQKRAPSILDGRHPGPGRWRG